MPEEHTGPYLQSALLAESVLREVDGRLSLIRITDQLQVTGSAKEMQPQPVLLQMLVLFKAGFAHGKFTIKVVGATPSEKKEFVSAQQQVYFEGEDRGVAAHFILNMILPEEGVFWFSVFLEEMFVTQVPLRIMYQQIASPPGSPSAR